MQKMLIILTKGTLQGIEQLEAITASMVFATYGLTVSICFSGDAIALLSKHTANVATLNHQQPFKSAKAMIESFEFYDVLPVGVDAQSLPENPMIECVLMPLNETTLRAFDAVIRW